MRHILKKVILTLISIMFIGIGDMIAAEENNSVNNNPDKREEVTKDSPKLNKIMDAIIQIESEGDKSARNGNSLGILQITPVLVKECNAILKEKGVSKRYSLSDRLSEKKSKEMFILIMNKYNKSNDPFRACQIWKNGVNSKKSNRGYWQKFLKRYKK